MRCDSCKELIDTGYEVNFDLVNKEETLLDPREEIYVKIRESLYNTHLCEKCMFKALETVKNTIHGEDKMEKQRKAKKPS